MKKEIRDYALIVYNVCQGYVMTKIGVFAPSSFSLHPPESAWIQLPITVENSLNKY